MVLLGLAGLNLEDTTHEVLVRELGGVLPKGKLQVSLFPIAVPHHTSLHTHGFKLGTVHVLG